MGNNNDMNKYFIVLGVDMSANDDEVRSAYMNMVKVWHPDNYHSDPKLALFAQQRMKEINEAYNKIKEFRNSDHDRNYDIEKIKGDDSGIYKDINSSGTDKTGYFIGFLIFIMAIIFIVLSSLPRKYEIPPPPPPPAPAVVPSTPITPLPITKKKSNIILNETNNEETVEGDGSHNKKSIQHFFIGSTREDVLISQGTPSSIETIEVLHEETWRYGPSKVVFKNGVVREYDNRGNLNVVMSFKNINR